MHKLRKQNLKLNKNVDFRIVNIGDNISTSMCCVTQTIHIKFMVILKWFEINAELKTFQFNILKKKNRFKKNKSRVFSFLFVYYVCKNIMLFMPLFKIRICWRFGRYSFHTYWYIHNQWDKETLQQSLAEN